MKRQTHTIFRLFAVLALVAGVLGSLVPVGKVHGIAGGFVIGVTNPNAGQVSEYVIPFVTAVAMPPGGAFIVTFPAGTGLPASITKAQVTWTSPGGVVAFLVTDADPVVNVAARTVTIVIPAASPAPALVAGAQTIRISQVAGITNPFLSATLLSGTYTISVATTAIGEPAGVSAAYAIVPFITFSPAATNQNGVVTILGGGFTPLQTANVTAPAASLTGSAVVAANGTLTINAIRLGGAAGVITVTDGAGILATSAPAVIGLLPTVTVTGCPCKAQDIVTIDVRNAAAPGSVAIGLAGSLGITFASAVATIAAGNIVDVTGALGALPVRAVTAGFDGILGNADDDDLPGVDGVLGTGDDVAVGAGPLGDRDVDAGVDDFRLRIRVPSNTAAGTRTITVNTRTVGVDGFFNTIDDVVGVTGAGTIEVTGRTVTLSPTNGPPGTVVTVTGAGFPASVPVAAANTIGIATGGAAVASGVATDSGGGFTANFTIPAAAVAGARTVTVTYVSPVGDLAANTGFATFTVTTPTVTVALTPNRGPKGTTVAVTGGGFTAAAANTIAVGGMTIAGVAWNAAVIAIGAGDGNLAGTTQVVPAGTAYGTATILATETNAASRTGIAAFTVAQPTLSVSPTTSSIGGTVTAVGAGWVPGSVVFVTRQAVVATAVTADAVGGFTTNVPVPAALWTGAQLTLLIGSNDGATGNASAASTVTVPAAVIVLSAATGAVGSSVTVTGSNFLPITGLTALTLGGIPVLPATPVISDAQGSWSTAFTLPGLLGVQNVAATHGGFGVTAPITVTEAAPAVPGQVVATVALAGLINTAAPATSRLSIAWYQDLATGTFRFLAPGVVTSTLVNIPARSALFLNLTASTTLRIDGVTVVVPAGGRWVVVIDPSTITVVP